MLHTSIMISASAGVVILQFGIVMETRYLPNVYVTYTWETAVSDVFPFSYLCIYHKYLYLLSIIFDDIIKYCPIKTGYGRLGVLLI